MKNNIKKLVLFSFILVAVIMISLNVSAATIKETTDSNDEFGTIEEGTIIIGISKFTPNNIITGVKAATAGANDIKVYMATNNGSDEGYTYPKMYYYLLGDLYEYDEEGKLTVAEPITSFNIYYVDNKPKTGIIIPEMPVEEQEIKEHTIFFVCNNEVYKTEVVEEGKTITLDTNYMPTINPGYTFENFVDENGKVITNITNIQKDMLIIANVNEPTPTETYTVFFMNGTEYESVNVAEGETVSTIPTFTKEDYTFVKFVDENGETFDTTTTVNRNMAVFAEWKLTTAKVTNETELNDAVANTDITTIKIENDFNVEKSVVVSRDLTIDGQGNVISKSGTPEFVSGGDNYILKLGYGAEGTKITLKDMKLTNNMAAIIVGSNVEVTVENVDVTGNVWGGIEVSHNGLLVVNSITMEDESYEKPVVWVDTDSLDTATVTYEDATKVEYNKEGNIQYHYYTTFYTISYNSNGGSEVASEKVVKGQTATEPQDPTKEGYIFKGWKLDNADYNFDTVLTGDIELTANWKSKTATVSNRTELETALADAEIEVINLGQSFEVDYSNADSIVVSRSVTIDGKDYAITRSDEASYKNNGPNYVLKLYSAEEANVTIKNISLTGNMAAMIVGSNVNATVENVNVTGNVWGGIEVSGNGVLTVNSIIMEDEEYEKPVVWVDTDSLNTATVNYENSYMTDQIKQQYQYYTLSGLQSALNNPDVQTIEIASELTIPAEEELTLDLNGKTLILDENNDLNVNGKLVLEDTTGNGAIELSGDAYVYVADSGELVLNNGKISSDDDYAVYADNGKITMDGGEIISNYACITSNNTTGDLIFEMNGGTLTAKLGPAIYMPSPISITINDGTINGGIGARMGDITINGGTINSIEDNIDSPSKFYGYTGNVWFPDAIFIIAGTYNYSANGLDNHLNLNIAGGTINCLNEEGSAVAIYNLGKVEQEKQVTITENANLTTNSITRDAFEVLAWDDFIEEGSQDYKNRDNSQFRDTYTKYVTEIDLSNVAEKYKTNN